MTLQETARLLGEAYLTFPHLALTEGTVAAWFKQCGRVPADTFEAAIVEAINSQDNGFFPAPGQVTKIARRLLARPEDLETSDEAWAALLTDETTASVRAQRAAELLPGWRNRGQWLTDSMPFKKRDFDRVYNDLKDKDDILNQQGRAELIHRRRKELTGSERQVLALVGKA
jgi:hypothetical protein